MNQKESSSSSSSSSSTTTTSQQSTTAIYQKIFKKIYESKVGVNKNSWEYFTLGLSVYKWLTDNDSVYTRTLVVEEVLDAIYEIFDIIISILEMLKASSSLLAPIVYYSNIFVKRAGIKHNQLFNLLLTSTIVTLKFWSESIQIRNILLAEIFEFPLESINVMEKRFLNGIDYNLNITQQHINNFLSINSNSYYMKIHSKVKDQQKYLTQYITSNTTCESTHQP